MQIYSIGAFKMKAEIISCGTELLLGEVVDTNTPYLAEELAKIGISVYHHTTVGDNPKRLLDTIIHAKNRSDLVFISGGLGPTQDDITKDILADYLGLELVVDPVSLQKIKGRYNNRKVSSANHHQSLVIEDSIVLKNDIGMAAGMFVEKNHKQYALLPGPPNEFEHMVNEHLIPLLIRKIGGEEKLESRNLNFYGLPEAKISEELDDLIEAQSNPTIAIYAKKGIIDIRLTVSGSDDERNQELLNQTEEKIMNRIGSYFVSYNQKRIKDIIVEELTLKNESLSIIEIGLAQPYSLSLNNPIDEKPLKASLAFSDLLEAKKYFEITGTYKNGNQQDYEEIAYRFKKKIGTDYVLIVSASGRIDLENESIPEKIELTIIDGNKDKISKEIRFDERMYLADWVITLKISDFIRRYLLSLEQLKN